MGDFHPAGIVGEVGGVYFVTTGVLIRTGIYRGWADRYRDVRFNIVQRQGVLARVPLGMAVMAASTAVALDWSLVGAILLWTFAAACFAAWLLLALSAPPWLKPMWLRSAETLGWPEHETGARALTLAIRGVGILILITLAFVMWMHSSPEEWIGPLISGVGVLLYQYGAGRLGKPRTQ